MTDTPAALVISACAGSGKTHALIQRLLALLEGGAAPGEILAITFTRKAAAEIKTRLLAALAARAAAGERWAAASMRALLFAARAEDELNIHTFHGWFGVLLAGRSWSPAWFGPADLTEDDTALRRLAWRRWLDKTAPALSADASTDAAAAWRTVLAQCSPYALQQLFTGALVHHHNAWRLSAPPPPPPDTTAARARLQDALAACAAVIGDSNKTTATARAAIAAYINSVNNDDKANNEDALAAVGKALLTAAGTLRVALARAADSNGNAAAAEEAADAVNAMLTLDAERRALIFHAQLATLADGYLREFESVKAERNQLSFDDLEHQSYEHVKAHGDINTMLYRINQRFRHLLIDEFQDTSPLQWQVIRCWLEAAHGGDNTPSVFIVGDAKQAIYRFRHGDSRLLGEARAFLRDYYNATLREEDVCRRLSPRLLDFANAVFSALPNFTDFRPHRSGAPNADLRGRVEWHEIPAGDDAPAGGAKIRNPLHKPRPENDRRQRWADAVATRVRDIVNTWGVDDGAGGHRRVTANDVLLLLPQFTHAAVLRQSLQRQGLACAARGGGGSFADTLACRDIAALVAVLLSPDNSLSLAQVLKSPLFALSEQQLADAAMAEGGLWRGLCAAPAPALQHAAATLQRWRAWAGGGALPAHDLLMRIFADGDVLARYRAAVAPPYRRQVTADLEALLDFALAADGGRQPLPGQFADALQSAATAADGGDGIRLMTVHGAKGLEAPIVVLADCTFGKRHSGGGRDPVDLLIDWPPDAPRPARFIFRPSSDKRAFADIAAQEADIAEREYDNLFYVALTRARQGLVIFSHAGDSNPRLQTLRQVMTSNARVEPDGAHLLGDTLTTDTPPPPAADTPPPPPAPLVPAEASAINAAQAQHGETVHRQLALLLQDVDDATVAQLTGADTGAAQQLLQNTALQKLLKDGARRDVEVEFIHAGRLLRIDLLIEDGDTLWIIDYKTGGGALERYATQMNDYIAALAAAYPQKRINAAFITPKGFFPHPAATADGQQG